ncbi:hypothetical protein DPX16_2638 [Anabarilius grahami]|uniref:Uncharacterized protein n=1 Tax=Anabarilius grahami TaxID=495550 RepID=A0A3N0Y5W2_ANAGA|nr:hypothetical protein DPX16_2638 [Anabarilius grahami]
MRIVSNGVQPYIVQTGVDTDGETQEEVTTFRMKLDISEWFLTDVSPESSSVFSPARTRGRAQFKPSRTSCSESVNQSHHRLHPLSEILLRCRFSVEFNSMKSSLLTSGSVLVCLIRHSDDDLALVLTRCQRCGVFGLAVRLTEPLMAKHCRPRANRTPRCGLSAWE